jgi:hypothetical protein
MIQEDKSPKKENKLYKVLLVLLIAMATISAARKDLNEFLSLANEAQTFADRLFGAISPTVHARTIVTGEVCTAPDSKAVAVASDDFQWKGHVAEGKAIEIKGISGSINAEPATSGEVEVVATKTAQRGDPETVKVQLVEHPGGVTICAIYPSGDSGVVNTCEPGNGGNSSGTNVVRNTDVRVDFTVKVPAGVAFIGKTVNGEISAASLSSKISTSGYAQAKTVNGEIVASLGNASWPDALEFKTVNGAISLNLPANLNTKVSAETLNGQITSDFPMSVLGVVSRKQINGTIGGGGRELVLKTLNGSISLRRAG